MSSRVKPLLIRAGRRRRALLQRGDLARQVLRGAVGLDHQQRAGAGRQVVRRAGRADGVDGALVHEFERTGQNGLVHDAADRVERGAVAGEAHAQGGDGFRRGQQLERGFGDEREGAAGADQQAGQVVAGDALGGAAAGADFAAVAGDGAQPQHVVAGDAVFDGTRAGGVHREVAADAAVGVAAGVGRVEQAGAARDAVDFLGDHAGLDDDEAVGGIEFEHAPHAFEADDHAAGRGQGAADVAGAGAARGQRNAVLEGDAHERRHLVVRGGEQHGIGLDPARGFVAGVDRAGGGVVEDAIGAEGGTESGKRAFRQHGGTVGVYSGGVLGRQLGQQLADHVGVEIHADVPARIQRNRHAAADAAQQPGKLGEDAARKFGVSARQTAWRARGW
jgi:hypothetical protein